MGLCPAAVPLTITLQTILTVRQFSAASFHASILEVFCTLLAPMHTSPYI
jgi:hypothetical protein